MANPTPRGEFIGWFSLSWLVWLAATIRLLYEQAEVSFFTRDEEIHQYVMKTTFELFSWAGFTGYVLLTVAFAGISGVLFGFTWSQFDEHVLKWFERRLPKNLIGLIAFIPILFGSPIIGIVCVYLIARAILLAVF